MPRFKSCAPLANDQGRQPAGMPGSAEPSIGKVAGLPSEGATPCAMMPFAAMLLWYFFSAALSSARPSLVGNTNLI